MSLVTLLIFIALFSSGLCEECRLPKTWEGSWFINEFSHDDALAVINSTSNYIWRSPNRPDEYLGNCVWSNKADLFVFHNKEQNCKRCILILEKHQNVLYSKEGFCTESAELKTDNPEEELCHNFMEQIHGDGISSYWFRTNYVAEDCPFGSQREIISFNMSYSKSGVRCELPASKANQCVNHTRIEFRYQACYDQTHTVAKDERLTCIGHWTESNLIYMVANVKNLRFTYQPLRETLRCFAIKPLDSISSYQEQWGYDIGTMDDATCNGIHSPEVGETTLYLRSVDKIVSKKSCRFPAWLAAHKWMDMDSEIELKVNLESRNRSIYIFPTKTILEKENHHHYHGFMGQFSFSHSNLKCRKIANISDSDEEVSVLAEYAAGCQGTRLICLRFVRQSKYIFQLFYKPLDDFINEDSFQGFCYNTSLSEFQEVVTMISTHGESVPCPSNGNYVLNRQSLNSFTNEDESINSSSLILFQLFNDSWSDSWSIGCKNKEIIQKTSSITSVDELHCLDNWTGKDLNYAIVLTKAKTLYCMVSVMGESVSSSDPPSHIYISARDCFSFGNDIISAPNEISADTHNVPSSSIELIATGPCDSERFPSSNKYVSDNNKEHGIDDNMDPDKNQVLNDGVFIQTSLGNCLHSTISKSFPIVVLLISIVIFF